MAKRQANKTGNAMALDFLNTRGSGPEMERLASGEGLIQWLQQAGVLDAAACGALQRAVGGAELDAVAAEARGLREWFRQFVDSRKGRPLRREDLEAATPLNDLLKDDAMFTMLAAAGDSSDSPLRLQRVRRHQTARAPLLQLAEILARFVCDEPFANVKICEGAGCCRFFLDNTQRKARRWCSMATCGNRAKQHSHRCRHKDGRQDD